MVHPKGTQITDMILTILTILEGHILLLRGNHTRHMTDKCFTVKRMRDEHKNQQRLGGGKDHWPTVSAKVERTQEIPDRAAKMITIRVDKAQIGSDVCMDGAPNVCHIAVESTLSRVREGNLTEALVANTSGVPITLKHGQHIGQNLIYDRQVASEPKELPSVYVSTISSQIHDAAAQRSPSLEPFIKVTHYSSRDAYRNYCSPRTFRCNTLC